VLRRTVRILTGQPGKKIEGNACDMEKVKKGNFFQKDDNIAGYLFISPWLFGFFAFTIIPLLASFFYSFTSYDLLSAPKFVGLENYFKMCTNDDLFLQSMGTTLVFVVAGVPLRLIFALAIAMLFTYKTKLEGIYRAVYYLPSLIGGSVAIAVLWKRLFGADGIFNAILAILGINTNMNWLGNPNTSLWTLILLFVWQFGSPMLIFLAGLKQIPVQLYEAANIDGANSFQRFCRVTLPQLTPIIFFNIVMQMITAFTIFTQSFVISNGTGAPLNSLLLCSLYLYRCAFVFFDMGYGCALAWAMLLVVALATVIIFVTKKIWVYED
jgi:multiple sugar transport system permease protein